MESERKMNIPSEGIGQKVKNTVEISTEEAHANLIITSSTFPDASEVIEQIRASNPPQNLLSTDQRDVVKVDENEDDQDKQAVTEKSTEVKLMGSLGLLCQYASSSDEANDMEDDDSNSEGTQRARDCEDDKKCESNATKNISNDVILQGGYRSVNVDAFESDADESDMEYITDEKIQTIDVTNDADLHDFLDSCDNSKVKGPIRAKGEMRIEDLPPIEELSITVAESECVQLGTLHSVVDTLVLVESLPNFAALDIDTVLFLDSGNRTLGQVFDVMGNIASPIYCVRFNCEEDIKHKDLTIGMKVFVAPQTEYTHFIILPDLMNQKGCDASWENDNEVPNECNEFSDDEEERLARRKKAQMQRNQNRLTEPDSQLSEKIIIKNESASTNNHRHRYRKNWIRNTRTAEFYKDNRGYNNDDRYGDYNQHKVSDEYNHCWHTATLPNITPLYCEEPVGMPALFHQNTYPKPNSNFYPNPFAPQMSYNQFHQQALPLISPRTSFEPPQKT